MKRLLKLVILFMVLIAGPRWSAYSNTGTIMYFYNPETNIDNFATLKTAFDTYLSIQGNYHFQPFDDRENFESVIGKKKGNIYLLSSWHLDALRQRNIPLEIALIGTSKGKTMHRKVLSAKRNISDIAMLKDTVIAGAGSKEYIQSVLRQIAGSQYEALIKTVKILAVPKDIDAVMAVGFGMAGAAISAESSLAKLEMINPKQFKQLQSLGFSKENYLLVAATLEAPDLQETRLLEILGKMSETSAGENHLKLLGIDGWKPR